MFNEELYRLLVRDRARKRRLFASELFCDEETGEPNEADITPRYIPQQPISRDQNNNSNQSYQQ